MIFGATRNRVIVPFDRLSDSFYRGCEVFWFFFEFVFCVFVFHCF